MITKFETLCRHLEIKLPPSAEDLDKLIHWCEQNISTDFYYEGTIEERFAAYQELATSLIEHIKPNAQPTKLMTPLAMLKGMTPLQFSVDFGLDIYLKTLKPSALQINTKINGISLFQLAAIRGHYHTAKVLLALGAISQEKNSKGQSVLFSILMLPIQHNVKTKANRQLTFQLLNHSLASLIK